MFGGICFMVRGHMGCGIAAQLGMMVRVGPERYTAALSEPFAREMDFTGRAMKGFVDIAEEGVSTQDQVHYWVQQSLAFIDTLPKR